MDAALKVTKDGLFCTDGRFFIDAWNPVPICVVTHAHGDHAYAGHGLYIGTPETIRFLQHRLGNDIPSQTLDYHQKLKIGNCSVSLHPAGHILGSAQIRIESAKGITVISGDYKRAQDDTCKPFETVKCDTFVTESTFALPVYEWPENTVIAKDIYHWWQENAQNGHPSILFCYALGKAQRVMNLLRQQTDKAVYVHGSVYSLSKIYQDFGVLMMPFTPLSDIPYGKQFREDLIIAPPFAFKTPWMKRFPSCRTALASGWMEVRGTRRRAAVDKGFVLSDHADWKGLLKTVEDTGAQKILTTHGNSAILAQYLKEEKGLDAQELKGLEITDLD